MAAAGIVVVHIASEIRNALEVGSIEVNLPEFIDACGDLDFVVDGTRLECGVDGDLIATEIFRSNMMKEPNGLGKPIKPYDWTPPDIDRCLREQGWK